MAGGCLAKTRCCDMHESAGLPLDALVSLLAGRPGVDRPQVGNAHQCSRRAGTWLRRTTLMGRAEEPSEL